MNESDIRPRARDAGLVTTRLPDETLVYDLERHRALCLNAIATAVWQHCDGKANIAEMSSSVSQELAVQVAPELVWFALRQLSRARLLADPLPDEQTEHKLSRRKALRRIAAVGALTVGLPAVLSVVAPSALQAQGSCQRPGQPCGHGNNFCCAGPASCVNFRCV